MRNLTEAQLDRVGGSMISTQYWGYLDCHDLDSLGLNGRLSLVQLRLLVELLTVCEQELVQSSE